jgi:hypothetical protein
VKRDALASFVAELTARKAETTSPVSALISKVLLTGICSETAPFHDWFKTKGLELTGIDPNKQPLGPESSCIYEWGDN